MHAAQRSVPREVGGERVGAASGAKYARRAEPKAQWDADNLFRIDESIVPVLASGA